MGAGAPVLTKDKDGKAACIEGIVVDITRRKLQEQSKGK